MKWHKSLKNEKESESTNMNDGTMLDTGAVYAGIMGGIAVFAIIMLILILIITLVGA